jgi:methylenetetrahydrofolate reductase (NADPH)
MERMRLAIAPIFSDITWGAGGSTCDLSLELAIHLQSTGHTANLHMTCTNISNSIDPIQDIRNALQTALQHNVTNIVALRGDPPAGEIEWKANEKGFTCALDLVQFIRSEFGNETFGISVAGYPEGHPSAITEIHKDNIETLTPTERARASTMQGKTYTCLDPDYHNEILYLKKKIDAGADFIITQMFFDVHVYQQFVKDCRQAGITCPIVPGIMCINTYAGFVKMTGFCKTRVPIELTQQLEQIQHDPVALKEFGIEYAAQQCRELLTGDDPAPVLHFYTLNLEKVVYGVLEKLGCLDRLPVDANENDAATQVATGSAWARVGDTVTCLYGIGIVLELNDHTAAATVKIIQNHQDHKDGNTTTNDGHTSQTKTKNPPLAFLQKGQYQKMF